MISEDYDQGLRRLKRSYKRNDVDSNQSDSQFKSDDQLHIMDSASVAQLLTNSVSLNAGRKRLTRSHSVDRLVSLLDISENDERAQNENSTQGCLENDFYDEVSESQSFEPKGIYYLSLFYNLLC